MKKAIVEGLQKDLTFGCKRAYEMLDRAVTLFGDSGNNYVSISGQVIKVSFRLQKKVSLGILASLQKLGYKEKDCILVDVKDPRYFYDMLWACLYGGIIMTALPRPNFENLKETSFYKVWNDINKPLIVTDDDTKDEYLAVLNTDRVVSYESLLSEEAGVIGDIDSEDAAYIQFSSGSTGNSKGAVLTNRNLIETGGAIIECQKGTSEDRYLTWLPHTHNFGAFIFCLAAVVAGGETWYVSPETFIRNPIIFLKILSEQKIQRFCTNNLGIKILIAVGRQIDVSLFDFSHLEEIYIGAERPSIELIEAFIRLYSINRNVIRPGYGLSEAVAVVTISSGYDAEGYVTLSRNEINHIARDAEEGEDSISLLSHGRPLPNLSVGIFDDDNQLLGENYVGSIKIKGPTVFKGYCVSATQNGIDSKGWLNTGDRGFIRDGNVYITGRSKEIVIIRGVNYMLPDLEDSIRKKIGNDIELLLVPVSDKHDGENIIAFIKYPEDGDIISRNKKLEKISKFLAREYGLIIKSFIAVESFKYTSSHKIDRFSMRNNYEQGIYKSCTITLSAEKKPKKNKAEENSNGIISIIKNCWSKVLEISVDDIGIDTDFGEMGGDSVKGFLLIQLIEEQLNENYMLKHSLDQKILSNARTVRQMSDYIEMLNETDRKTEHNEKESIKSAITGIAFRLPKANNQRELWNELYHGHSCVRKVSEERKSLSSCPSWDEYLGEISGINEFDYEFFGISMNDASFMDPQQRLALEVSYEALDDAGEGILCEDKRDIAVISATCGNTYLPVIYNYVYKHGMENVPASTMVSNLNSTIATRVSQYINAKGISMSVDTACSSFMTAVILADRMIVSGETQGALIIGTNVYATNHTYELSKNAGILTNGDRTKVFDKDADGSLLGEGIVCVFMEGLEKAQAHKKQIYGVIEAEGFNNDGTSLSIMAPNPYGQADVLNKVYGFHKDLLSKVSYIETHGTGTKIGDLVELNALQRVFQTAVHNDEKIPIGSIKSNIGHLLGCAGGAALIKVLLCMKHKTLVPTINIQEENQALSSKDNVFRPVYTPEEWQANSDGFRYAGISSFGIGGTNAHIVISDYPEHIHKKSRPYYLLTLSAKDRNTLEIIKDNILSEIEQQSTDIGDLCYTLSANRNHYRYRFAAVIGQNGQIIGKGSYGDHKRIAASKIAILSQDKEFNKSPLSEALEYQINKYVKGVYCFSLPKDIKIQWIINLGETVIPEKITSGSRIVNIDKALFEGTSEFAFYSLLKEIYVCGGDIAWNKLYHNDDVQVVNLPAYPFKKTKVWL